MPTDQVVAVFLPSGDASTTLPLRGEGVEVIEVPDDISESDAIRQLCNRLVPVQWRRFTGSAWSGLPTHKRWAIRVQGTISAQQWELLSSPWKYQEHVFWRQVSLCELINNHRYQGMSKLQRRKLHRAMRLGEGR